MTASALLDLASDAWLKRLAARCVQAKAAVVFALSYDGRLRCSPAEPDDEMVRTLVNAHQRTDKGFGMAAGPDAAHQAQEHFARAAYHVQCEHSDWVLPQEATELQRQLVNGWAEAAAAVAPERGTVLDRWRTTRLAHIDAGRSEIVVGHTDLAAWP